MMISDDFFGKKSLEIGHTKYENGEGIQIS